MVGERIAPFADHFGKLDVVINNVGYGHCGPSSSY
jgi:NAD(P)-dependent dehydrogenase (short-subunit alcohol dehydrogenase family)